MKKITYIAIICSFYHILGSYAQTQNTNNALHLEIQQETAAIADSLINVRRYLHQYPELSGTEEKTAYFVAQYLRRLGLEVHTGIGGHGVVGILRGTQNGPKIAWRADMDALPSEDPDGVPFASKHPGVRHQCGHDVHTTIALGIASVLSQQKKDLKGTVYFIFQPSEENYKGANAMIADGLFDLIQPDEIYSAHISPMPSGLVATKPDYVFANYRQLKLTFEKSNTADVEQVISDSKAILSELQNVPSEGSFWDNRNLLDPNIGVGSPNTIFKDYITVEDKMPVEEKENTIAVSAYLTLSNPTILDSLPTYVERRLQTSGYANALKSVRYASDTFVYGAERKQLINDAVLAKEVLSRLSNLYGDTVVPPMYGVIPDGRGDDFSFFQERVPGVYFLMGGSNFEKGIIAMPHAPNFHIDENCIPSGVTFFSSLIVERLHQ